MTQVISILMLIPTSSKMSSTNKEISIKTRCTLHSYVGISISNLYLSKSD